MGKVTLFEGVSGSGKSTIISLVFYELKKLSKNPAIVPDITHYSHIITPHMNLYDGGGLEEFSYFYLFIDRMRWHFHCLHTLRTTSEHDEILVDESPLSEYCVAKVRGARKEFLTAMEKLLKIYYREIDRILYCPVEKSDRNYKHKRPGVEYGRKFEMIKNADDEMRRFLLRNNESKEKVIVLNGQMQKREEVAIHEVIK